VTHGGVRAVGSAVAGAHRLLSRGARLLGLLRGRVFSGGGTIWDDSAGQYERDGFKVYWELLPAVQRYQRRLATGDETVDPFLYAMRHLRGLGRRVGLRGLSLGCTEGDPGPEMSLVQSGRFAHIDVLDVAGTLLARQAAIAERRGLAGSLAYRQADLNAADLGDDRYDLIWAVGTVHHVERLESFFDRVNRALTDTGVFMMREYVGPSRFRFTEAQLTLANDLLAALPERYRRNAEGALKERVEANSALTLALVDPSEAVRSADILPLLRERLDVIRLAPTGGTLLHPLLDQIASNFERDEDGQALLRLLIRFESELVQKGVLASDYAFALAGKRRAR
jgi:SAM-dependent methyltransferase